MSRTVVRVQPFVFRQASAPASRSSRLPMPRLTSAVTHGADHSGSVNQVDYPIGLTKWIKPPTVGASDDHDRGTRPAHRTGHDPHTGGAMTRSALISGGGIAGPSLAYWLG